jgi:Protein of unknown function (DUF3443)
MSPMRTLLVLCLLLALAGCGGSSNSAANNSSGSSGGSGGSGGSTPPSAVNVQPITVNAGLFNKYANGAFASVTICVPGSTNCQTIDNVLVDTGSYGLRLISSLVTLPLTNEKDANGNSLANCIQYVDKSYNWGPVAIADVKLAGETASSVPLELIGGGGLPAAPSQCSGTDGKPESTAQDLGANGILGIGPYQQDCGLACTLSGSSNPGVYFTCTASTCNVASVPLAQQVQNPVFSFSTDNNGVILQLPAVNPPGATSVPGSMIFGIGTQSNNSLGSATAYMLDNSGDITVTYNGQPYSKSYVDSGSNAYFFLDSNSTGMPMCKSANSFYCPASAKDFNVTVSGTNGASNPVTFTIANAESLFQTPNAALPQLGGDSPNTFDFGLPFFYGRSVAYGYENHTTPAGNGPFVAF